MARNKKRSPELKEAFLFTQCNNIPSPFQLGNSAVSSTAVDPDLIEIPAVILRSLIRYNSSRELNLILSCSVNLSQVLSVSIYQLNNPTVRSKIVLDSHRANIL
jgi:hypothetical protein